MLVILVVLLCVSAGVLMRFHLSSGNPMAKEEMELSMIIENPIWMVSGFTSVEFGEIHKLIKDSPEKLEQKECLEKLNNELIDKFSFLLMCRDGRIYYNGSMMEDQEALSMIRKEQRASDMQIHMDEESQYLFKRLPFQFRDGTEGEIYVITDAQVILGQLNLALKMLIVAFLVILVLSASLLALWLYQGIIRPLRVLRKSSQMIIEGNLDYSLLDDPVSKQILGKKKGKNRKCDDEISRLFLDFDQMRLKMKGMIEERIQFEKDQSELISNISHDLKTPLTAIKGYSEGLMDGVADTKEKQKKYLSTIYKKADDMTYLVDELSFYSKIDCNTIPYEFRIVNLNDYFMDCIEDISLDLEIKNINLSFFNYVEQGTMVVADVDKLKRVLHNILGNAQKYMNKEKGIINIRIRDKGIFVEVEIEDNGCGIDANDIENIFDRFYRSDASRNSKRRGSGLGLAISKKIIEDHGGKIWATSVKNVGTSIFFTLCRPEERMVFTVDEEDIVEEAEGKQKKKGIWR